LQFKFNVDGEWRYDDQQPYESGNYGVVNTVFLQREPDVPPVSAHDNSIRANMEVDDTATVVSYCFKLLMN